MHTVLKRLIDAGEVKAMTGYDKRTVYWWNYPLRTIVLQREPDKDTDDPRFEAQAHERRT